MRRNWWLDGLLGAVVVAVLAASGCTGTDFLSTGNLVVPVEVVVEGTTDQPYDCVLWTLAELHVRPLDGVCEGGTLDGEPCFSNPDCPGGTCEGATAKQTIGSDGVLVVTGPKGDLDGDPCVATADSGFGQCTQECLFGSPPNCIFFKSCTPTDPCDPNIQDNVCAAKYGFQVNTAGFRPPEPLILPDGLWEVNVLSVGPAGLYIDNPGGGAEPVLKYCSSQSDVVEGYDVEDLRFRVVDGQASTLRIVIDVGAMEDALPDPQSASCPNFFGDIDVIQEFRYGP